MANDLIAAVATPPGTGSIGVVRLSGTGIDKINSTLLDKPARTGRICRRSMLTASGNAIDRGIVLLFAAPHSYTGEDVMELQGHGGTAVMSRLLRRCFELGARPAEPGEFTQRAYLNGRLDLAQAEGIADLISAATERAAKLAAASANGEISARAESIAGRLNSIRAECEATIDFSDEGIQPAAARQLRAQLAKLAAETEDFSNRCKSSIALREAASIALIGAPNVGKSSLLNCLAGREAAIVAAQSGTTRDIVPISTEIDGCIVHIADTAGIHQADNEIEREGMRRARQAAEQADLVIEVRDATAQQTEALADMPAADLIAVNKIDLAGITANMQQQTQHSSESSSSVKSIFVSAKTGAGISSLRDEIAGSIGSLPDELPALARERHVDALNRAASRLAEASAVDLALQPEIAAELLRDADNSIGLISGRCAPDDILGEIFSRFCIGK